MITLSPYTPILSVSGYRVSVEKTEYVDVTISPGHTVVAFRPKIEKYFKYLDSGLFTVGRDVEDYVDELLRVLPLSHLEKFRREDPGLPPLPPPIPTIKIGEVYVNNTNSWASPIVPTRDGQNVMISRSLFGKRGDSTHAEILASTYKTTGKTVEQHLNDEYGVPIAAILRAKLRSEFDF